jgi:hypothetical protein
VLCVHLECHSNDYRMCTSGRHEQKNKKQNFRDARESEGVNRVMQVCLKNNFRGLRVKERNVPKVSRSMSPNPFKHEHDGVVGQPREARHSVA